MLHIPKSSAKDAVGAQDYPSADKAYDAAQKISSKALALAEAHGTPPVPKTYEVWYAYASGNPEAVVREIDSIIENNGTLHAYELEQIHREFISTGEQARKYQETLGVFLDREMEKAVQRVHRHLVSNEHYSGSLKKTATSLSAATTPRQVRETVEVLLTENARMRAEAVKLNRDLEQTRIQVRKLRNSLEKSRENEFRDPLTGVSNRRFFERALNRLVPEANADGTSLCLVMADLDHFKAINDNFGHQVGDDVLRYFASLLQKNVKGQDIVARYGGEEFAIIFPSTTLKNTRLLVEQIMTQLGAANLVVSRDKHPLGKVTSSFGVASLNRGEEAVQLVRRADARLYQAKHAGRNRVVCDEG